MNDKKQKSTNVRIQASLRQKQQRLSWRVDRSDKEKLALRFGPTAWAKLVHFRDKSDNEVGGFAITDPDDLLIVREFVTVKQEVTCVSVKFDDQAVADFFDTQVDFGRKPEQFAHVWLHSHPGDSPEPSVIDEETFERVFGNCQWAVLFVVARDNKTYAKLRFNVGPGGQVLIPTEIDYSQKFSSSDHELWDTEYVANVKAIEWLTERSNTVPDSGGHDLSDYALPYDSLDEFEHMESEERQFILDELADRPDLWDEKGGDGTMTTENDERFSRQRDIVPPERIAGCRTAVIGVGAIGRQVALQFSAMGIPWLQMIDHDKVEWSNLASQGYLEGDMGQLKVNATLELCLKINATGEIHIVPERFRRSMEIGNIVFCCVDKIDIRRLIWESVKDKVSFFVDGRMSAEVVRILTAYDCES